MVLIEVYKIKCIFYFNKTKTNAALVVHLPPVHSLQQNRQASQAADRHHLPPPLPRPPRHPHLLLLRAARRGVRHLQAPQLPGDRRQLLQQPRLPTADQEHLVLYELNFE